MSGWPKPWFVETPLGDFVLAKGVRSRSLQKPAADVSEETERSVLLFACRDIENLRPEALRGASELCADALKRSSGSSAAVYSDRAAALQLAVALKSAVRSGQIVVERKATIRIRARQTILDRPVPRPQPVAPPPPEPPPQVDPAELDLKALDQLDQAATLRAAAALGTPFCAECEKAKRQQGVA